MIVFCVVSILSDEGLISKCLLCNSLQGPIYVINSVDNTKFPCYTLPPMQHHSFFRNLPPLSLWCWCKPTLLECLRGCQHPSNKFEILWQVAQNLFSLLLSYFVAQYVLIIVVWFFFVKIYFSFWEMTFFVWLLKYANFHREYYPSCVTSCNEYTRPTVFLWT